MSRIGKKTIKIPSKVKVNLAGREIQVQGPKGELSRVLPYGVKVSIDSDTITVGLEVDSSDTRSVWGLSRTLIDNMVVGVEKGFTKTLVFTGVGYKASLQGNKLNLSLGFSHAVDFLLPDTLTAKVAGNSIELTSPSKELVGLVAAKIRDIRPPEPYKGKGIKYIDEVIVRKAGKTGAKK
jgi:large subunit ribosomal protein L6